MLIDFSVSNFMSFNHPVSFTMTAGKARKYSDRIYNDNRVKLSKCKVFFGANASGKSNLIYAFRFMQSLVCDGLPRSFSNKYFRMDPENKNRLSEFQIKLLVGSQVFTYGFSIVLSSGSIRKEFLFENLVSGAQKVLYERDIESENFQIGPYFKQKESIERLRNYGEDSANDHEILFLTLINKNKGKMYHDFPELKILRQIYNWFSLKLNISFPNSILTGYPYFTDSNLEEIADLLNALGTGISELKIVEVPRETIRTKLPDDLYEKIVADLEKANAKQQSDTDAPNPRVMIRSYKEFFTFEIDSNNVIAIATIEFSHENKGVYFDLNEESDGTARLLDLIEILFKISDDQIFVIDEIDRCLHPVMTVRIIELFLELAKKRNTQLIITSHESRLLASDILRNDEISFIWKNMNGESIIDPLEGYQLRADKKVYAALFDGTISAIPQFDDEQLVKILF